MAAGISDKIMLFRVGSEMFGLPIGYLMKVLEDEEVTWIPRYPSEVAGAILFEGMAMPVFHLGGVGKKKDSVSFMILVSHHDSGPIGIVIDEVKGIVEKSRIKSESGGEMLAYEGVEFKLISPSEAIPVSISGAKK